MTKRGYYIIAFTGLMCLLLVTILLTAKKPKPNSATANSDNKPKPKLSTHDATDKGSSGSRRRGNPSAGLYKGDKPIIFRGPDSIDPWTLLPEGSWEYENQSFISRHPGSIARDIKLPEQCSISFMVTLSDNPLDFRLSIFSKDIENIRPRSGYEISFIRDSIYPRSAKTGYFIGSSYIRNLSRNAKVKIEVRADRNSGKVLLLIDDSPIDVWHDQSLDMGEFGSGLHWISNGSKTMCISDILITPWDGQIDEETLEHINS